MLTSLSTLSSSTHLHTLRILSLNEAGSFSVSLSLSCFSNFSHPLLHSLFFPPFLSSLSIFRHHPPPLNTSPPISYPAKPPTAELICSWLNDWICGCQGNLVSCSRKGGEFSRRQQNPVQLNIKIKASSGSKLRSPEVTKPL